MRKTQEESSEGRRGNKKVPIPESQRPTGPWTRRWLLASFGEGRKTGVVRTKKRME